MPGRVTPDLLPLFGLVLAERTAGRVNSPAATEPPSTHARAAAAAGPDQASRPPNPAIEDRPQALPRLPRSLLRMSASRLAAQRGCPMSINQRSSRACRQRHSRPRLGPWSRRLGPSHLRRTIQSTAGKCRSSPKRQWGTLRRREDPSADWPCMPSVLRPRYIRVGPGRRRRFSDARGDRTPSQGG